MGNTLSTSSARLAGMSNLVGEVGNDVEYEKSMGSSRFLKAIRARHRHGPIVVKTFIKPDPGMSLRNLVRRLRVEREALADVPNVLTYQKVIETEKAGYLIRQWLSSNLYDRISTRPFLTTIEKKWITYQLIYAMRDARGRKIPHGDLKCENILVTSSLMVYVTDFAASFKPTYLPLDDPADFSFFFDTSGRRTCYVAPERFYEAGSEIARQKASVRSAAAGLIAIGGDGAAAGVLGRTTLESAGAVTSTTGSGDPYTDILGLGKRDGKITEAMDVFSLGCVIAELWRDGSPTFTLSQLFKYREGIFDIEPALAGIADEYIRDLVRSMISLDPGQRKSFDQYLLDGHGKAFPASFYDFFHQYLVDLQRTQAVVNKTEATAAVPTNGASNTGTPAPSVSGATQSRLTHAGEGPNQITLRTESDERIEQLYEEWSSVIRFFDDEVRSQEDGGTTSGDGERRLSIIEGFNSDSGSKEAADKVIPVQLCIPELESQILQAPSRPVQEDGTALIVLSVILANLRNCLRPSTKCHALDILLHLSSRWLSDETKLDRVVPFAISLLDDDAAQVRLAAIRAVTQLLLLVQMITLSNASIFTEYIMPNIKHLSLDPSTAVRCIYASCIVSLANTGERYLQMAQAMKAEGLFAVERDLSGDFMDNQPDESNYDAQMQALQSVIQEQITTLLTDPSASVKRSLLENIAPLCSFYGVAKTNDVLLSHMITYLNDRNWLLREAFFETIVGVAAVAGDRSVEEYILPLMTQALADTEEFVVVRVINGLTHLIKDKLLRRAKVVDLLASTMGFLCHPNIWIREAAAGFIAAAALTLEETELWATLYPSIRPLLKSDIHEITELSLLDSVKSPLPRPVFQAAMAWASKASKTSFWRPPVEPKVSAGLRNGLATEGIGLLLGKTGCSLYSTTITRSEEDDGHLDRLRSLGMENDDEAKLVALRDYIWKVAKQTSGSKSLSLDYNVMISENEQTHQIRPGLEVQTLEGITPQTIFFSAANVSEPQSQNYSDEASVPGSIFRSQHDGSFTSQIAKRRLAGQRITGDGTWMSPIQEVRRRMVSNASGHSNPTTPARGSAELGAAKPPPNLASPMVTRPGSPITSPHAQSRLGMGKAPPAIAPNPLNALGTMTDHTTRLRNNESGTRDSPTRVLTPSYSASQTARHAQPLQYTSDGSSFSSTYDGKDPYIRAHLEAIYLKTFRDRPEFGPRVNAGPPRRRGMRSALPSGPKSSTSSSNRRPEGTLIAYFTEHSGPVTSIAVSPDHLFFVSGSEDGTLKVWDTARLEKNVTSRSRATYSAQKGAITAAIAIESSHCIASTATDGSLHVWRIDLTHGSSIPKYSKPKLISNFQLSTPGEYATCLIQSTSDNASNLILGTSYSRLTVLDLRTMQVLQTLRNPVQYGPITCLCVDKKKSWLLVGTLGGMVSLWDLRFGLLLRSWQVGLQGASGGDRDAEVRESKKGGIMRVNRCALHPSKGRGRWVLIASERIASSVGPSSFSSRLESVKAAINLDQANKSGPTSEVLVETWDIDKGIRIETFEAGSFPQSNDSSPAGGGACEAVSHDEAIRLRSASALSAIEAPEDTTRSPAAAIERLVREKEAQEKERGEEEVCVQETSEEDDDDDFVAKVGAQPQRSVGSQNLRAILRPLPSESCSVKALYASLEGYSSSSSSSSSSGQIAGGWLDAGKLAAEVDAGALGGAGADHANSSSNSGSSGVAGYMITAGEDRKIRFWDLGRAEKGVCIGIVDEKSEFRSFAGTIRSVEGGQMASAAATADEGAAAKATSTEVSPLPPPPATSAAIPTTSTIATTATRYIHQLHTPNSSSRIQLRSPLLAHPQAQYANALSRVHKDAITSLAVIEYPFRAIVAADRAGCIRVWE